METEKEIIYIYSTYTPAQRQSYLKYYQTNKELINNKNRERYQAKKNTEEYKEKKKLYNKAYLEKVKAKKTGNPQTHTENSDASNDT